MFRLLGGQDPKYLAARNSGYNCSSPDEKPVNYDLFSKACEDAGFSKVEVRPYHYYSLSFCVNMMRVKDENRTRFEPIADKVYQIDRRVFKNFGWENLDFRRNKFMLCGIRCTKHAS
jgi:hypothetical protein